MEVEVHAADGAVVFFEAVYDCAYAVVPSVVGGGGLEGQRRLEGVFK